MEKEKIVVYTCVVGDYDILLPPPARPDNIRFICFTDQPNRKVTGWEMLSLAHPSSVRRPDLVNRYHKLFPHRILPDSDWSIYVDGNVCLIGDIPTLVNRALSQNAVMACPEHLSRSTIFEEAKACKAQGKFDLRDQSLINRQLAVYKEEGMPQDAPLSANYLIVRCHKSNALDDAMKLWWKHLQWFTRRDQISLPYVLWKTDLPAILINKYINESEPYYIRHGHQKSGLQGWYQWIYLHRNEIMWCRALYLLRKWLLRE